VEQVQQQQQQQQRRGPAILIQAHAQARALLLNIEGLLWQDQTRADRVRHRDTGGG
jgi:hypothetical protein